MSIPALMYHRICHDEESFTSPFIVRRSVFLQQVEYMARHGYVTPTLDDLGSRLEGKPVVLTFDDGYLDTYETAFPILRDHGFRAIVFPVADFSRRTNWWDSTPGLADAPLMTRDQTVKMHEEGCDVGSHGVSHRSLPTLAIDALRKELEESRASLGMLLGSEIRTLAYPYGDVDSRVKGAVEDAGYHRAFAVNSGPLTFNADPFEIRRVRMGNNSNPAYIRMKLTGVEKACRWSVGLVKTALGKRNALNTSTTSA